jgi:hypothetical protein
MTVLVHFCYLALSHDQQKITEQYKNTKAGFINSDIWPYHSMNKNIQGRQK